MKTRNVTILSLLVVAALGGREPCVSGSVIGDDETVLDREVHIEKQLVRRIPAVPRFCVLIDNVKRRVSVGDCKLYCELEGEGTALVLLHGGPGATHHCFHPSFSQAADFARVIYYDQRGCGLSDYEKGEGYTIDQAVDDLEKLRKGLDVDRWIVLGHSYGGLVAQRYAVEYPDHLAGLVLVGSVVATPTELDRTRQHDFLSEEERARIREIHGTAGLSLQDRIYNAFLSGDWKRQHYYKPSREKLSRIALYEWKHDRGFNSLMSGQMRRIDLGGAFDRCPIPTLIVEGKWDLTWNTDKPGKLLKNHPGAKLVMFAQSGHSPFDDEPERFFAVLRDFAENLPEVPPSALAAWKEHLASWKTKREASLAHLLRSVGWGLKSSEKIVKAYSTDWLSKLEDPVLLMRTGFALYDLEQYEEALRVFKEMSAKAPEDRRWQAVPLVWQGHVLDLLDRRDEAIAVYQKAADLNVTGRMQHAQYGLTYSPSDYAAERIKEPFGRIENREEAVPAQTQEGAQANQEAEVFPLHQAALEGDLEKVKSLLANGAGVNAVDDVERVTPLHAAAFGGHKSVAELLIDRGADIEAKDVRGATPLLLAAYKGHKPVVELLIRRGAKVSAEADGQTPLEWAEKAGHKAVAELLRKHGAKKAPKEPAPTQVPEPTQADEEGERTPLHEAARRGDLEEVENLLAKGADVDAKDDKYGATALYWAAFAGRAPVAELLIAKGADVNGWNDREKERMTPLHAAAWQGHAAVAEVLIAKGADVNAMDDEERVTPLHMATFAGHSAVAELLISNGAQMDIYIASVLGEADQVAAFLKSKPALINARDTDDLTPLHWAARGGQAAVAALLMGKGAVVGAEAASGLTPLHIAVWTGDRAVAELLIAKGAKVDARARQGMTPLHLAALRGHPEVVRLLVDKGADVNAKNQNGRVPLDLAEKEGHEAVVELLRKHGAREGAKGD